MYLLICIYMCIYARSMASMKTPGYEGEGIYYLNISIYIYVYIIHIYISTYIFIHTHIYLYIYLHT
jgi:hypothetical protein